ncbi:MAG: hypothetical protein LC104_05565 [Bacteroidales bacterium]|nr:hypothetical protein [Bacteroidales bacterium]
MSIWLRELAGWVLLGTGLAAFGMCYYVFLLNRRVIEAAGLTFIGFVIFRAGLHLLKVAIAARIAHTPVHPPDASPTKVSSSS